MIKTTVFSALAMTALALPALAAQAPAGTSYQLNVVTSFEPSFTDCWAFSNDGRFIVSHQGGLGTFPYQLDQLNGEANHFQAVWRGRISIGFSGVTGGTITGDAVDGRTRTYSFTGSQVSGCGNVRAEQQGFQVR